LTWHVMREYPIPPPIIPTLILQKNLTCPFSALQKVAEHQSALNTYLTEHLETSPVRSLEDLVAWNAAHPDLEFPPGKGDQSLLERAVTSAQDTATCTAIKDNLHHLAAEQALDPLFDRLSSSSSSSSSAADDDDDKKKRNSPHPLDALIGPADSHLYDYATAAGYNTATLPLGKLHYRLGLPGAGGGGRPFGLVAIGRPGVEGLRGLVKVVSAWEATWQSRAVPDLEGLPFGKARAV
jgi:amidase